MGHFTTGRDKIEALKKFCGHFGHKMTLSNDTQHELKWWVDNVQIAYSDVCVSEPDMIATYDASLMSLLM